MLEGLRSYVRDIYWRVCPVLSMSIESTVATNRSFVDLNFSWSLHGYMQTTLWEMVWHIHPVYFHQIGERIGAFLKSVAWQQLPHKWIKPTYINESTSKCCNQCLEGYTMGSKEWKSWGDASAAAQWWRTKRRLDKKIGNITT